MNYTHFNDISTHTIQDGCSNRKEIKKQQQKKRKFNSEHIDSSKTQ